MNRSLYFVAAGSKYDSIYAEIVKSAGTLRKTMTSPKYASVASDPSVKETQGIIWRGILNEVMTILREQKDLTLLPLARGCVYALFSLRPADEPGLTFSDRYAREIAEIQKNFPDLHIEDYLPIPRTDVFRFASRDGGAWLTNPFLDDVFSRQESSDVRARLLPNQATLDLSARGADGKVTRKFAMSFALVPDGNSGTGLSSAPFYMATMETPLEAIRCYRDDAGRWDPASEEIFFRRRQRQDPWPERSAVFPSPAGGGDGVLQLGQRARRSAAGLPEKRNRPMAGRSSAARFPVADERRVGICRAVRFRLQSKTRRQDME